MSKKVDPPEDLVRLYEEAVERFPDEDHRAALTLALLAHRRKRSGRRGRPPVYGIEELFRLYRLIDDEETASVWQAAKGLANELPGGGGTPESKAKGLMRSIDKLKSSGYLVLVALHYMKSNEYKEEKKKKAKDNELGFPRDIEILARLPEDVLLRELRRRGHSEDGCFAIIWCAKHSQSIRWYRQIQKSLGPVVDTWRQLGAYGRPLWKPELALRLWKPELALRSWEQLQYDVRSLPQVSPVPRWQRQFEPCNRLLREAEAALHWQQHLRLAVDLQHGAHLGYRSIALQGPLDLLRAASALLTDRMPALNMVWPGGGPGGAGDLLIDLTTALRRRPRRRRRGRRRWSAMRRRSRNRRQTNAV